MPLTRKTNIRLENNDDSNSLFAEHHKQCLLSFSRLGDDIMFVRDLLDNSYKYISENFILCSGYTYEEIVAFEEKVFEVIIPPDDIAFLNEHEPLFYEFVNNLEPERQQSAVLIQNYSFIHKDNYKYPVSIHLTPLAFDSNNQLRLLLGKANFSIKAKESQAAITMMDTKEHFRYDSDKKQYVPIEPLSLSDAERKVVILAARGYTEKDLATKLNISVNTVKKHKSNIYNKLGANNIAEAYVAAINNKVLIK